MVVKSNAFRQQNFYTVQIGSDYNLEHVVEGGF